MVHFNKKHGITTVHGLRFYIILLYFLLFWINIYFYIYYKTIFLSFSSNIYILF